MGKFSFRTRLMVLACVGLAATPSAFAAQPAATSTVPAAAIPGNVRPFTAQEKSQGAQAHTGILQEFGDAMTGTQADYVRNVAQGVAVQSGLSANRSDFTVTLLNSSVDNAFALPGGYIYCTRQLMALMNNEAELAGVLSHELGHTAARHAKQRQSRATRNTILGVLGTVLGGAIGDNGGLLGGIGGFLQNNAMQGAQLLTLSYSRAQETEADDLGITYIGRAGYDPAALSTVLASLAAQNTLDARAAGIDARAVPAWASTHPEPEARVRRALAQAQAMHITNGRLNRDPFLNALNNVMYGDDPHQGVVEGQDFIHPDMRLRFSVPAGFHMSNGTQAVSISSATGQAQFSTGAYTGDLDAYVRAAFQTVVGQNQQGATLGAINHSTINGLPVATATAQATSQSGTVTLTIVAYEFARDKAYHFAAIAPTGQTAQFDPMFASLRRITDAEAAAVRPRRVSVVTVGRNDTMQSLANRMAYTTLQLERFQVLNGLAAGSTLRSGQRVKIVVSAAR